jgi:hypothetical protein
MNVNKRERKMLIEKQIPRCARDDGGGAAPLRSRFSNAGVIERLTLQVG